MPVKKVIKLSTKPAKFGEIADELSADMFVSSVPVQHSHSYYEDEDLGLYIGVWDTTDMVEKSAPYACDEFMTIIEGSVEIKETKTGNIKTVLAGESFVIPKGYDCQWRQQGYLRKFYVISEHPHETIPEQPAINSIVYINDNPDHPFKNTRDGYCKKELYVDHQQRFSAGIWQSGALNTELLPYPDNEFLVVTQGTLRCRDHHGNEQIFKQGDVLFIPQGSLCAWSVDKSVTLTYCKIKAFLKDNNTA